jgi:hypothetical protein
MPVYSYSTFSLFRMYLSMSNAIYFPSVAVFVSSRPEPIIVFTNRTYSFFIFYGATTTNRLGLVGGLEATSDSNQIARLNGAIVFGTRLGRNLAGLASSLDLATNLARRRDLRGRQTRWRDDQWRTSYLILETTGIPTWRIADATWHPLD